MWLDVCNSNSWKGKAGRCEWKAIWAMQGDLDLLCFAVLLFLKGTIPLTQYRTWDRRAREETGWDTRSMAQKRSWMFATHTWKCRAYTEIQIVSLLRPFNIASWINHPGSPYSELIGSGYLSYLHGEDPHQRWTNCFYTRREACTEEKGIPEKQNRTKKTPKRLAWEQIQYKVNTNES